MLHQRVMLMVKFQKLNNQVVDLVMLIQHNMLKKAGDIMTGVLNMGNNKINNFGTPQTQEIDAAVNVGVFIKELYDYNLNIVTPIKNAYKEYVNQKTALLDGAKPSYITNDKPVIYSDTGAVHAKSFYHQDDVEDEVRILTDNQDYDNVHL